MRAVRSLICAAAAVAAVSACSSGATSRHTATTVNGPSGVQPTSPAVGYSSTGASPVTTTTTGTPTAEPSATGPGRTVHPVPSAPLRTVSVESGTGAPLSVAVWADRDDPTCFNHAYGRQMIQFLTVHPCTGLTRRLAITTVNGRQVGIATESTAFTDPTSDLYATVTAFRNLVEQDGTGSIDDLLREGYRLPAGPTSVPDPDAFACLGQDNGVEVFDMWYLDGDTPANDPGLEQLPQRLFLQV